MAETTATMKRPREEEDDDLSHSLDHKRHRSYEDIFSILEEDDDAPAADLSSLISSFEQEITSETDSAINGASSFSETSPSEDDDVMRRLLEASDDELGLPSSSAPPPPSAGASPDIPFALSGDGDGDGLWEIEDDAANYYTLLQSELFMHVGEI